MRESEPWSGQNVRLLLATTLPLCRMLIFRKRDSPFHPWSMRDGRSCRRVVAPAEFLMIWVTVSGLV